MRKVSTEQPLVMGHEASGTVHTIGSAVASLRVGDSVAIEPQIPCRRCQLCKEGFYNRCKDVKFAACPPDVHGTLTKYFLAPEDFMYKVSDEMSLEEAALIEPLSVAVHTARLAQVKWGDEVVVTGSGTIGLLCSAVAKAFGASKVILVDILESKLSFARTFFECDTFLANPQATPEETSASLSENILSGEGVDKVLEASGAQSSIQAGILLLKPGGTYVQAGLGKPKVEIPLSAMAQKEITLRGCFRYGPGDYKLAIKLVNEGSIKLKPLITSITPFKDTTAAWEKTARGEGIKNMIAVAQD